MKVLLNRAPMQKPWHTMARWASIAAILSGCAVKPPVAPPPPPPPPPVPTPVAPPPPPVAAPAMPDLRVSRATRIQDYRTDVANHIYQHNPQRIYKGRMPALLYAVGVLQTDIDPRGYVSAVRWMRAPSHAPEVMAEIERTVREAAPYPAPVKLGKVSYTETWLWHKSGKFQLHTLTEGQD